MSSLKAIVASALVVAIAGGLLIVVRAPSGKDRPAARRDDAGEPCRAWQADRQAVWQVGQESARAARSLLAALEGDDDPAVYAALVEGERTARAASRATTDLSLATDAGRAAAGVVAAAQREVAGADRRLIGRSGDLESWRARPSTADDLREWTRRMNGIASRFRASRAGRAGCPGAGASPTRALASRTAEGRPRY